MRAGESVLGAEETVALGTGLARSEGCFRVKKPLLAGSYIGLIVADKESGSSTDPYNRAGGVDARFTFFKNLNLRGYYAKNGRPA